jgi:hypothetical protein
MTMVRECLALPAIFLTIALLGGFRAADFVRLVPPPLMSLALGMLLMGCLARARVLIPEAFMHPRRSPAANISGLIVLLALFAACAQIFNLVTPETGLLHVIFSTFFLVQLLTTLAAVRDRMAMLRGLTILLGAAFLIRFAVLESLYSKQGGLMKRVLTTLMEGVTLGGLEYTANGIATGYVAFFTLTLFMIGLVLLAPEHQEPGQGLQRWSGHDLVRSSMVIMVLCLAGCRARAEEPTSAVPPGTHRRDAALAASRVWAPPAVPIDTAAFDTNPPGKWTAADVVECRFVPEP